MRDEEWNSEWDRYTYYRNMQRQAGGGGIFDPATLLPEIYFEVLIDRSFTDAAGTTPVTVDGDRIGGITNLGTLGGLLTQSTVAQRPTFHIAGGLSWFVGDGVDDGLKIPISGLGTQLYIAVAFQPVADQAFERILTLTNGNNDDFQPTATIPCARNGASGPTFGAYGVATTDLNNGTSYVWETILDGGFATVGVNGVLGTPVATGLTLASIDTMRLCIRVDGGSTGDASVAKIYGGFLKIGPALSGAGRAGLLTRLGSLAGISI